MVYICIYVYMYICIYVYIYVYIYMVSVIPWLFSSSHFHRAILEPGGDQLLGEQQTSIQCLGGHRLTVDGWLG